MQQESRSAPDAEILTYVVASGDMRFIEINERTIFLRADPELGTVIRGEVPGCGQECFANLSQILLESVMSSGDSREANRTSQAAARFGRRLGRKLSEHFIRDYADQVGGASPDAAITILLNSMGVPFESELSGDVLRFTTAHCPLRTAASGAAMTLWVTPAHRAFVALVGTLLQGIAPGWILRKPDEVAPDPSLREIELVRG